MPHHGHADKQGPQSSMENQAEIETYATGTNSPQQDAPEDNHAEEAPNSGLLSANSKNPSKGIRQKWTQEEYKEIREAYYATTLRLPTVSATIETHNIWRHKNPTNQTYLDANKLANVRQDKKEAKGSLILS